MRATCSRCCTQDGHVDGYVGALAIARRSQFEARLLALLDPAIERRGLSRGRVGLVILAGVLVGVPVATAARARSALLVAAVPNLSAVAPAVGTPPPAPTTPVRPVVRQAVEPAAPARPVASADLFAGCEPITGIHYHEGFDVDVATWTVSISGRDCRLELTARGALTFNSEATTIDRIAPQGWVEAALTTRGETTQLTAHPGAAGAVAFSLVRNGQDVAFPGPGEAWVAALLLTVDWYTAFAVDQRLPALLHAGGPEAALDEIERIRADHAKTVYLQRLLSVAALDRPAIVRTATVAAILGTEADLLSVARAMRRRGDLPDVLLLAILHTAAADPQDEPKAVDLMLVARARHLDGDLRRLYLDVAATIRTDELRRRVLQALTH